MGYLIWKIGIGMLRSMTRALPPPPPPGEMRKINLRYRCDVCGVELKHDRRRLTRIRRRRGTAWRT